MNNHLRQLLVNQIKKALADSDTASMKKHPYLIGKAREILLDELINPLLNKNYSSGTGHVVDYNSNQSREMDICLYGNTLLPPFFYRLHEKLGMFPFESVLSCIEVKTSFNKTTIKDAFEKFRHFRDALKMSPGFHNEENLPLAHVFSQPRFYFFAFNSDVQKYSAEHILNIYRKVDPEWDQNPLIQSICVAGKGWVCNTGRGWYHMAYNKKTKINEEIIGFLSALVHDLDITVVGRGTPRIGYYLTNPYEMDKIKNGKKIRNTWRYKRVEFSNTDLSKLRTYTATIL